MGVEDHERQVGELEPTQQMALALSLDRIGEGEAGDASTGRLDTDQEPLQPDGLATFDQEVALPIEVRYEGRPKADRPFQLARGALGASRCARNGSAVRTDQAAPRHRTSIPGLDRPHFSHRLFELPLTRAAELLEIPDRAQLLGHQAPHGGGRWQVALASERLDVLPQLRREREAPWGIPAWAPCHRDLPNHRP